MLYWHDILRAWEPLLFEAELVDGVADVAIRGRQVAEHAVARAQFGAVQHGPARPEHPDVPVVLEDEVHRLATRRHRVDRDQRTGLDLRSEEHTPEFQSLRQLV